MERARGMHGERKGEMEVKGDLQGKDQETEKGKG